MDFSMNTHALLKFDRFLKWVSQCLRPVTIKEAIYSVLYDKVIPTDHRQVYQSGIIPTQGNSRRVE